MISSTANSSVLDLLFVLASGYIALIALFPSKYTGYVLYFRTVVAGLVLLSLAYVLITADFLSFLPLDWLNGVLKNLPILSFLIAFILLALRAIVVWFGNKYNLGWAHKLQLSKFNERGFDQYIYEKIYATQMVLITLENQKVYAGWPFEVPNNEDKKWLCFATQLSGYRYTDSTVKFQTNYSKVFDEPLLKRNLMIISVEKIVSVQPFDIETYLRFNPDV